MVREVNFFELANPLVPPRFNVSTIRPARPLGGDSRQQWISWVPKPSASPSVRPGRRKNFFVVWCGRSVGVFYRWCDAHASVAGYDNAKFKGFDSLEDAELAYSAEPPS